MFNLMVSPLLVSAVIFRRRVYLVKRLLEKLNQGINSGKLILAAAAFGKTTVLSEWAIKRTAR